MRMSASLLSQMLLGCIERRYERTIVVWDDCAHNKRNKEARGDEQVILEASRKGRPLFREPFFALLDVLVEKKGHVMNDESQNNGREKVRCACEFRFECSSQIWREGCVEWCLGLTKQRFRVLVQDLRLHEQLR